MRIRSFFAIEAMTAVGLLLASACGDSPSNPSAPPAPIPGVDAGDAGDGGAAPDANKPDATTPPPPPGDPKTGQWLPGFGGVGLGGEFASVDVLAHGPNDTLYAGGTFTDAAGTKVRNVARWTGTKWEALGDGLAGHVAALAVDATGQVWAAGALGESSAPNQLARWDGTKWTLIAGAIESGSGRGTIRGLAIVKGGIAAIGDFAEIDNKVLDGIALYGTADNAWHAVGASGVPDGEADALSATADGFCVTGTFAKIGGVDAQNAACWNGSAWSALGTELPDGAKEVLLKSPAGKWFVGGSFSYVDPTTGEPLASGIASLEGNVWKIHDGGVSGGASAVRGIGFAGDTMLVAGNFSAAGTTHAGNIARWSLAGGWKAGPGILFDVGIGLPENFGANDLIMSDKGGAWIGGMFSGAGGAPALNVARIDGDKATAVVAADAKPLGISGGLDTIAIDRDGAIVAGGYFSGASDTPATNLARFDGHQWTAIGGGVQGDAVDEIVVRRDGSLVVGGRFGTAGTEKAGGIAIWDGAHWSTLLGGVSGKVGSIAEDEQGNLYVGGSFDKAGTVPAANIAVWDGKAWKALGAGLDALVTSIAFFDGKLIAGGQFHKSGTTDVRGLAAWDGKSWQPVGGGIPTEEATAYVTGLAVAPKTGLVVGGTFKHIGTLAALHVAAWDGTAWHGLGDGLTSANGDFGMVTGIVPWNGGIFATGIFDHAGVAPARNVAWWDGAHWIALGDGLNDLGESLVVKDNRLYVGGPFTTVGASVPSLGIGVWEFGK